MISRNTTKIAEVLRKNEKRRGWANNENNLKVIWRRHVTDGIHSYVKLRKTLGMAPGKLEESGKILEKTCGLGPTEKEHRWKITWKGNCTGWIKWLEWDNNLQISWMDWEWKHRSSEISSTLQEKWIGRSEWLRGASAWQSIRNEERIWSTKLELNPPEQKKKEEWWTWDLWASPWEITG